MPVPSTCSACASPLARDQRYCLECGARVGPPRVVEPPVPLSPSPGAGRMPRPRTAAALILAMLGAGSIVGAAAGPGVATERPRIVAVAPAATAAPTPSPTPAAPSGSSLPDDVAPPAPAPSEPAPEPEPAVAEAPAPPATAAAPTPEPTPEPAPTATPAPEGPPAKHVVVVSLTGHDAAAFAAGSPAAYLANELVPTGALLSHYRAAAGGSIGSALSLLAGADAETCLDLTPADCGLKDGDASLPSELTDGARSWKAYVQGLPAPCATDPAPFYSPARNPFAFMALQDCGTSEASTDALAADFADTDLAPSLAYVVPDMCHDGREVADCAGQEPTGLLRADAWLRATIPAITQSKAFADDGLLVVLFDGANLAAGSSASGALVVSSFARKGVVSKRRYDDLSLLRTIAGTFGVEPPGASAGDKVEPLGHDVLRSQDLPNSETSP